MYPWLASAIENATVIVTASRRLARDLQEQHAGQQLATGRETWHTAQIYFRGDWLNRLLDSADQSRPWPLRIDPISSVILWERCLAKHSAEAVLSFAGTVQLARQAWQRLQEYDVPLEEVSRSARSTDQRQFARAARAYDESLRRNHWVDAASIPALVAAALESRQIIAPASVLFAGFDRLTPAMDHIVGQLRRQGCVVEMAAVADRSTSIVSRSFRDRRQELRAAGLWARGYLQKSPRAKLAIICPDLQADAAGAARLVREGLAPGWQYAGAASRRAVDVSYGRRLNEFPAIAVALLLLRWLQRGLPSRDMAVLLRSPFISGASVSGRSRCELELRLWPDRTWSPTDLATLLRSHDEADDTRRWHATIERVVAFTNEHRGNASPTAWAERFDRLLVALGWPGESPPDSAGYQLLNRWRAMLAEFAATGLVTPERSMTAAVDRICSMASEVIFQPEAEGGIVQLLGVLEASGLSFDAVWVCGMDTTRWPLPPNPLALVSRALQEEHSMPDATPHDNYRFAELLLGRIRASAGEVVLSWARSDGDADLSPSRLLSGLELRSGDGLADPGWHAEEFQDPSAVATVEADPAPPILPGEKVAGGAYTVQAQATEPFTAFARGRLRIRDVPAIESGLPAAMKGSILHRVLHRFLSGKPDSGAIAAWTEEEIDQRIERSLSEVLLPARRHLDATHCRLLEFEQRRLRRVLKMFVESERLRQPFAIEKVEFALDFERFGVPLALRVDRVDRLADNSRLIIDYKTGTPKSPLDRDGRLLDLQLVVYAMAIGGPIGGLVLINLDSRAISYKGTGGTEEWDPKRHADWTDRLASWIEAANTAIAGIAKGDIRIDLHGNEPESGGLAILSRVAELKRAG
ncbi:MAG TPA: PD-(D/E)XK nuclease family protein [Woeseiaceae bacterium]|nr:PD-(D/E)XK nuclease family protein [Woeseiaceae bacterium]